jgi:hypothetical protein
VGRGGRGALGLAVATVLALGVGCSAPATAPGAPATTIVRTPDLTPGAVPAAPQGRPLLTLTGRIATTNAPGALRLDRATLDRLGLVAMSVDDPWAKRRLDLQGVRLRDLVALAHPAPGATGLHLHGLDDYQVDLALTDVDAEDIYLVSRDGQGAPLPVEDGGPTRIVFSDGLAARFSSDLWIWNLDTIEVR